MLERQRSIPQPGEGKRGQDGYLGYLLRQAASAHRRRMDGALAALGLTHSQFVMLTMLRAYPGASNADLARLAVLTPQTVHAMLAILERRDLIARAPDPRHGRVQTTALTTAGAALLKRARAAAAGVEAELEAATGEGEAAAVRRWLVAVARMDQQSD